MAFDCSATCHGNEKTSRLIDRLRSERLFGDVFSVVRGKRPSVHQGDAAASTGLYPAVCQEIQILLVALSCHLPCALNCMGPVQRLEKCHRGSKCPVQHGNPGTVGQETADRCRSQ